MALVTDKIVEITKKFLTKAFGANDVSKAGYCVGRLNAYGNYEVVPYDAIFTAGELPKLLYNDRTTIYDTNKELLGKPGYGFNMIDVAAISAAMESDAIKEWIVELGKEKKERLIKEKSDSVDEDDLSDEFKIHYPQPYFSTERANRIDESGSVVVSAFDDVDRTTPYIFADIIEDDTISERFWSNTVGTIVKNPATAKIFVEGAKYLFQTSLYDAIFMFNYSSNIIFSEIVKVDGVYADTTLGEEVLTSWHAGYDDLGKALRWLYRELFEGGVDPIPFITCGFTDVGWAASSKDTTIAHDNMLLLYFKKYNVKTPYAYNLSPQAFFNYLKMVTTVPDPTANTYMQRTITDVDVIPYYDATYNKYEVTAGADHQKRSKAMLSSMMITNTKNRNISPFMENPECVSFALDVFGYHSQGVLIDKMKTRLNLPIIQISRPRKMYTDQYKLAKKRQEEGSISPSYEYGFGQHIDFIRALMELIDLNPDMIDKYMHKTYMVYWLQEMFTTLFVEENDIMSTASIMLKFCERHPSVFKIDIIPTIFRAETFESYFKNEIAGSIKEYDPKRKELIAKNAYNFMKTHQRETINDYIHDFIAPFAYEYNTSDEYKGEMTDVMFYISATDTRLMRYYILNLVNYAGSKNDVHGEQARILYQEAVGTWVKSRGKKKYPTIHLNSKVFLELFKYMIAPMLAHAEGIPKKYAIINIPDIVYCQDFIEYSSRTKEDVIRQRRIDTENNILAMAMYYLAKGDEFIE